MTENPKSVCLTEGFKSLVEADEILHVLGEYHDNVLFPNPLPEDAVLTPAMVKMAVMQAAQYLIKLRESLASLELRRVEIEVEAKKRVGGAEKVH